MSEITNIPHVVDGETQGSVGSKINQVIDWLRQLWERLNNTDNKMLSADRTVVLYNTMSTSEIIAEIESQPKNLNGYTLTFQFTDGIYALSDSLIFKGFNGGVLIINGNVSEDNESLHDDQAVELQFTDCNGIVVKNGACSTFINNIHVTSTLGYIATSIEQSDTKISGCYLESSSTTNNIGVKSSYSNISIVYTYFNGFNYAIYGVGGTVSTHNLNYITTQCTVAFCSTDGCQIAYTSGGSIEVLEGTEDNISENGTIIPESIENIMEHINTHIGTTTTPIHGSAVAATANRLIHRDAAGRAQIATPSADADIVNKLYVDNRILKQATIIYITDANVADLQNLINAQPRNLNNYSLTFKFSTTEGHAPIPVVNILDFHGGTIILEGASADFDPGVIIPRTDQSVKLNISGTSDNNTVAIRISRSNSVIIRGINIKMTSANGSGLPRGIGIHTTESNLVVYNSYISLPYASGDRIIEDDAAIVANASIVHIYYTYFSSYWKRLVYANVSSICSIRICAATTEYSNFYAVYSMNASVCNGIHNTNMNSYIELQGGIYNFNRITTIGDTPTNNNIPTEKAVKTYVDNKIIFSLVGTTLNITTT